MPQSNLLFVEQELHRWQRPEPPQPGTAYVFVGKRQPPFIVAEGERGLTQGELMWGGYSKYYEVTLGDRSLDDLYEAVRQIDLT